VYLPAQAWLLAFLITIGVEVPIAGRLLRRGDPGGWRLVVVIVVANLATHPAVWFIVPQLQYAGTPEYYVVAELWAIAVEALVYGVVLRGISPARATATAIVANVASFVVGLAVTELWPQAFF
jgi:hypothetical protein